MTRLDGADLSHYQYDHGPIDWPTLRASTWWVAHKATQGVTYVDPKFATAWPEMAVGFTHRLAYHWLSPGADPAQQAAHFLDTWDRSGGAMLDAEEGGITVAQALTWLRTVEAQ
ncbi:MAG TPA: GH25 family lysozyme, partial [Ilumatobacteraceae bacterium]|nr:GH25 family lysozyme [Ilumatobacteraceae bacterium]